MSRVEEITEKLIQMMTAESEWVKTGIELEEVHNGIRRVAEGVAPHVVRLLADEREACADCAYEYVQDMGQGLAIAAGVREVVLNTEKK